MMDNRLREEYLAMDVPEMKAGILAKVKQEKTVQPRRKVRPAAVLVMTAMVAVLAVTAGAVANGVINLKHGSYYQFLDDAGNIVKPTGFHVEDGVDVPLSDAALDNIMPYVFLYDEDAKYYETADLETMEAFIDRSMHLPEMTKDTAVQYRMHAYGTEEYVATIYVEVVPEDAQNPGTMKVHLRGGPINILTESEPKMYTYALPDGTPVRIAIADSLQDGMVGFAFYRYEDAVYQLRMQGENRKEILSCMEAVLDTVG